MVRVSFNDFADFATELDRATTHGPPPDNNIVRVAIKTDFTNHNRELFVVANYVTTSQSGPQIFSLNFSCGKAPRGDDSRRDYKMAEDILERLQRRIVASGCSVRGGIMTHDEPEM